MKSKYGFWKLCLFSLAGLAGLTGCKELKSDFSYTPTEPRAGQVVTFNNHSTGADDYQWTFGDNTSSEATSPSHVYCKPGTYTVSLRIIRNKVETRTHTCQVTILDTIPTIQMDSDSIYTYTPTTIKANVYNPWRRSLKYQWTLPEEAIVLDGKNLDSSVVVCYFTQPVNKSDIRLNLYIGEELNALHRQDTIHHQLSQSVLYRSGDQVYEQFIYLVRKQRLYQLAEVTTLAHNLELIRNEQDRMYIFGDTLTIASVSAQTGLIINGFQVDRLMTKIYAYNANGLYVCNINGSNLRQLVAGNIHAIKVDGVGNRLYWATDAGLFSHRLIQMRDNQEDFTPEIVNTDNNIDRISVNIDKH